MNQNFIVQFILYLLLLVVHTDTMKATSDYYFQQITIDKGLSQSTVNSILTDHRGMMWIATASGLNSFDRYEIKNYFHNKNEEFSLPGNRVYFIAEDSSYHLWVGTNNGLSRYDKEKDSFIPIITGKSIYSYHFTKDGILFGGNKVFYKYLYTTGKMITIPVLGFSSTVIKFHLMIPWKEDKWLIGDRDGKLWNYDFATHRIEEVSFCRKSGIASLFIDSNNILYVSPYKEGLMCYDQKGKLIRQLTTQNSALTNDIILDIKEKDGKIWLATDGGGINILHPDQTISSLVHIPGDASSLPVNSINRLYKDKEDNLWAGTVRGGIFGIKEVFIKTYKDVALNSTYGMSEKVVISLFEDKEGFLWIGTDGGGINRYNPYDDTFKHYPATYNEKIVSITDFSDSELLVCLYSKVPYLFNKKTGSRRPFIIINSEITNKECTSMYVTFANRVSKNKIYILSLNAYIYNTDTKEFSTIRTKENPKFLSGLVLVSSNEKAAYLIRENRLFEINHEDDTLRTLHVIDPRETIKSACRDKNGKFWLGTDTGLSYYDPSKKEYKKIETQLFNNISTLALDDQDRLWVGAQNMLFSYHTTENRFVIWGESDGFLPNELFFFYPITSITNNFYLGGVLGLVKIKKDTFPQDNFEVRVELMDVLLDGNSLSSRLTENETSIQIPWDHTSLLIKVISKEKDVFRKKIFRYSISGANNHYTESYSHSLYLRTLPPGTYSISVSCNTKDGTWSKSQKVLCITVMPPWYKRTWAISLMVLMLIIILFLSIRYIIKKKEAKLKWQMSKHEQEANKEKIRFLINVSHELRTPLTLIYAPLKRLLDVAQQPNPTYLRQQLTGIYRQTCQMRNMINTVLDVNKIDENHNVLQLHKQLHHLNEWIQSIGEDFSVEFEEKKITLTYHLDADIQQVYFDQSKCEIILSNLLMNALKFSSSGSEVTVSSKKRDAYIRISVSDQGIGLGHVDTQKLFTRFYQGSHDLQGSGIGLSYAKSLAEIHGGKIGACSNTDKGALFYFDIPLQTELKENERAMPHQDEEMYTTICKNEKTNDIDIGNYSILIVEDKQELCLFLKEELKGFKTIYTAEDGIEAIEIVTKKQPDIIISDIMMPRMDGYNLCKTIKQDIHTSHIPVILLTARGDSRSTLIGYNLGADAYLNKPFEMDLLLAVIKNQLLNREIIRKKYRELSYINPISTAQTRNIDEEFLLRLSKLINENLTNSDLDVTFLTKQINMSRTCLYSKIKALTGMGPNDYINRIRIEKSVQLLAHSKLTITEISDEVGFTYQRYFSTTFKQIKGVTPTQFRENSK